MLMGQLHRASGPGVQRVVCTKRALATFLARSTRRAEPTWHGYAVSNGRTRPPTALHFPSFCGYRGALRGASGEQGWVGCV